MTQAHYLSGPIWFVDRDGTPAKPGDLLAVEICNKLGDEWNYTAYLTENAGSFLADHFSFASKAIWYLEGTFAYFPHIRGEFSIHTLC